MYIFWQNQHDLAVDLVFSDFITFYSGHISPTKYKKHVEPSVTLIKNIVPADKREYKPLPYKIWTIDINYWSALQKILKLSNLIDDFKEVPDLICLIENRVSSSNNSPKVEPPKIEDFFHQQLTTSNTTSIDTIKTKLSYFFELPAPEVWDSLEKLTPLYKKAVRKYHPDLNGDDASKMSELNMLWQEYKNAYSIK